MKEIAKDGERGDEHDLENQPEQGKKQRKPKF